MFEVPDVGFLALAPRRLGQRVGIGAAEDDIGDPVAEPLADYRLEMGTLILDRVMQHRRNRLVLVAPVFQNQARHPEKVADVGGVGTLSPLLRMDLEGIFDAVG